MMARDMRKALLKAMEEFKISFLKKYPNSGLWWKVFFFNNFPLEILGYRYDMYEEYGEYGFLDGTYSDYLESRYLQSMTPRKFAEIKDATIRELGLDKKVLREIWEKEKEIGPWTNWCDIVFDLYVRLREKGFNHYDLTG